jgi:hypothetical protein
MRTDKVLWQFEYDQDKLRDPKTDRMPPEDNLRKLWRKHRRLFSSKLRRFGIRAANSVLVGNKGFKNGGHIYDALMDFVQNPDPDYGDEHIDKVNIQLASPGQGVKILYPYDGPAVDYKRVLNATVLGVIRSPFEPRIAVVAMEINRGWEGPPHVGSVRIVGGDLRF